jgi:hypothetical protein
MAKTNGEIRFAFTPAGGASQEIRVTVMKGMSAKDICDDIATRLTPAIGPNSEVQGHAGKLKVQGRKVAKLILALAAQTVQGISIELK